jgi:hypothetical protein
MQTECIREIPFRLVKEDSRTMSQGEGRIDYTFEGKPPGGEDQPIVYHVILEMDAEFDGELLPATPDRTNGWPDAYLSVDGSVVQYYTGYPHRQPIPVLRVAPAVSRLRR